MSRDVVKKRKSERVMKWCSPIFFSWWWGGDIKSCEDKNLARWFSFFEKLFCTYAQFQKSMLEHHFHDHVFEFFAKSSHLATSFPFQVSAVCNLFRSSCFLAFQVLVCSMEVPLHSTGGIYIYVISLWCLISSALYSFLFLFFLSLSH